MTEQPKDGGPPMTDPNLTAPEAVARMLESLRVRGMQEGERANHYVRRMAIERIEAADMLESLAARVAELEAEQEKTRRFLKISRKEGEDALIRAEAAEAKVKELEAATNGLMAILERNDTKGPIPDVEMMFCWLAAQDLRATIRRAKGSAE